MSSSAAAAALVIITAPPPPTARLERKPRARSSRRHSERCRACKIRVRELLERLYGTCSVNHRFRWRTSLARLPRNPDRTNVAQRRRRAEGVSGIRRRRLCESRLSGTLRLLGSPTPGSSLSSTKASTSLVRGNSRSRRIRRNNRWVSRRSAGLHYVEHHDATDNDPEFRDEQRAWYDTLRDLVPPLEGLQPTVRLYARDREWCSMDPDNSDHLKTFSDLIRSRNHFSTRTKRRPRSTAARTQSTLRVAMVFPRGAAKAPRTVFRQAAQRLSNPRCLMLHSSPGSRWTSCFFPKVTSVQQTTNASVR